MSPKTKPKTDKLIILHSLLQNVVFKHEWICKLVPALCEELLSKTTEAHVISEFTVLGNLRHKWMTFI